MPRSEECTTLEREEDRGCSTLLQLRPPHWIVHGLSYFVVVFVLVAFIGAAVVNVADSVECEFTLVARNALGSIRAPQRGIVEQVRGADGATVRRGEILFVIRTDQVLAQSTSRAELESELRALERERVSLDEQLRQELEHYHAEHELLKNELASQRKEEELSLIHI